MKSRRRRVLSVLFVWALTSAAPVIATGNETVFDSRGFEDDNFYPLGDLQSFSHQGWGWQPHSSDPSEIVDAGAPFNKVLRRHQMGGGTHRDWLYFSPVDSGILIVEMDVRVSTTAGRTLDFTVTELGSGRQHSFVGWGTNPDGDRFNYYDGNDWIPLMALDTGWHRYRLVNHLTGPYANTFDLFVDGEPIGQKLTFRSAFNPELHVMEALRINAAAGPAGAYADIDNLKILRQTLHGPDQFPLPVVRDFTPGGDGVSLSFDTHIGYAYAVEYTDDLTLAEWDTLAAVSGGGVMVVEDTAVTDRRFYRVRTAGLDAGGGDPGPGPADEGALFDGEMEYVQVELEDDTFTDVEEITLAVWVKLNVNDGVQTFINRGARGELFTLYLFNDHVRMLVEYSPGNYQHASTEPPPVDTWVHYAGTYDGQTIRLYVNGVEVASREAVGRIPVRDDMLYIGATGPLVNSVDGRLADVRIYTAALSAAQVEEIYFGGEPVVDADAMHFSTEDLEELIRSDFPEWPEGEEPDYPFANGVLATTDGFRGIWYVNGRSDDGLHKYSGGLGTYPQQHAPIAIYAEEVNKTFFTYGGRRRDQNRLLHMVSAYDHATGLVARPRILLDKHTSDAHDNPTMAIDADGYIWIFSNAHGTSRPSYIHRSVEPHSVEGFTRQVTTNFSYSQPWYLQEDGFVFLHTLYGEGRRLYVENSPNGVDWGGPRLLARIASGHYQISWPRGSTIGTAFNYHPASGSPLGSGLNYRTNLYYMESDDGGYTWRNVQGEQLELPLTEVVNPALAVEYESQLKVVYMKSMQYTAEGHPVILYLTTPGWQSGPQNDPRIFTISQWTGTEWKTDPVTTADNNYDYASLYIEPDGTWRIIGSTETGPQEYNTGGEMAMWLSNDRGESWELVKYLTQDSEYNHTYPRQPLNAHPDFYAFWADGHGRESSPSRFYFSNREGDVFRLPPEIAGDDLWVEPEPQE